MTGHQKNRPWRVVRQFNHADDVEVSAHRFEWLADLAAMRRSFAREHRDEVGVHYSVREVRPS